ncbi:MAG: penicillin-binding protein activator [Kiritimatiellia bacterium]
MKTLRRWILLACGCGGVLCSAVPAQAQHSLVLTNGYGDCYRMNLLRNRENYQAYRGICSYRGFSLSGCSTTGEVVMLRIKATPSVPEYCSIVSTSLRWGTTMYFLNDVFRPLSSTVMAGYENWFPFDMSCSVAMYVYSGGFSDAGIAKRLEEEFAPEPVLDEQRILRDLLAEPPEPQAEPKAYSLVMTNGYGDWYRMNLLRNRDNYQAYRGICSYRGFSLSGCSTTGEVVMLRIRETSAMPEHFSILSTSLRWGTTMYVLNDVFRPLSPTVMAGYENWYPFDMSCSVAMYINSGGFGAAGTELARPKAWPAVPAARLPTAAKADGTIRIGALVPLTGDLEDIGASYTSAYGKALADLAAAPGMPAIELLVENTDADPLLAAMKLEALYTNGVQVVLGPESSAECDALRRLATNGVGMLLLSSSATAVPLAIPDDNLMRLTMDDAHQARELARRIAGDGIVRLAVLKRSDMYGDGMRDAFWDEYANLGGTVFYSEYYPRATELFGEVMSNFNETVAAEIAASGAESLGVLIVAFDEGVRLLEAAGAFPALTSVRWYGTEGMAGNAALLANPAARETARLTRFVCSQPAAYTNAKYAEVADWIQAQVGHPPRTFAVLAYDALRLAALALQQTGGTGTVAEVRQAIRDQAAATAGASGPIVFNAADDRDGGEYEFLKVSDAEGWVEIDSSVPNAPIVRAAAHVTSNRFDARWNASVGATNHLLFVAQDPELAVCLPGYGGKFLGSATTAVLTNLTPGATYYYAVRAANAWGVSAYSSMATVHVWAASYATNGVPLWWLGQYYEIDGNEDELALSDTDGDGQKAWEERVAGTSPVDPGSRLAVGGIAPDSGSNLVFQWEGVADRLYTLVRATHLVPATWSGPLFVPVEGTGGTMFRTSPVDFAITGAFFRLQVELAPE